MRFLHAEGQSTAEINHRLCRVYGDNVMSDSCVREWCRKFSDGRTDVHNEGGQGRHTIVTDELVQKVDQCVRGKRRFTLSELPEEFPQTSRTTLYRIVTERFGYHKFCARWVPKQLTDFHKTQRMGSALRFFSATGKRETNFLTESWLVTRLGYSYWMQRPKSSLNSGFTRILPISPINSNEHCRTKKNDGYNILGPYGNFIDRIHGTRDHNNVRGLLWNAE